MGKAETLQRIREAEARVRALRADAEKEADRILREARREALDLVERGRAQADQRYEVVLKAAEAEIAARRRAVLDAGVKDSAALKARGSANVPAATQAVLERFKGAVHAPT